MKLQIYNGNQCSFFLSFFLEITWSGLNNWGAPVFHEKTPILQGHHLALISWLPTSLILDWWQMTKCKRPISVSHIRWALPRIWPGPYMGQPDYPHLLEEQFSPLIYTSLKKKKRQMFVDHLKRTMTTSFIRQLSNWRNLCFDHLKRTMITSFIIKQLSTWWNLCSWCHC